MYNFVNTSALHENKRYLKMELAKITAFFTGFMNVFLFLGAWFANLDNTKSTILFIVAIATYMYRFWRWRKTSIQKEESMAIKNRLDTIMAEREQLENDRIRLENAKKYK